MRRSWWVGVTIAAVVALTGCFPAADIRISTVAGNGEQGYSGDGGPATAARIDPLEDDVAVDSEGNLFIADSYRVRRVDADTGIISTYAGTGASGFNGDNRPATTATLRARAVAVDDADNLFIADAGRVRRVDATTGTITTVAGNGTGASWHDELHDGQAATAVPVAQARGLDLDADGNLFIVEGNDDMVLRVDAETTTVTRIAGDFGGDTEPGIPARDYAFSFPERVAVDTDGSIYVSDRYGVYRVEIDTGIITQVAGTRQNGFSGDGGPATVARLFDPWGLVVDDAGNLYIADSENSRVRVVAASSGIITTVAGDGGSEYEGDGVAPTSTALPFPRGLALAADGRLFTTSYVRIRAITVGGAIGGAVHGATNQAVAGMTVELYAAGDLTTPIATDLTDANGWYAFSVRPGSYRVHFLGDATHQGSWWSNAATGATATPITVDTGSLTGPTDQVLANANLLAR